MHMFSVSNSDNLLIKQQEKVNEKYFKSSN